MAFYHATTAAKAREILRTHQLCSAGEPHVYVSTSKRIVDDYGDGTLVRVEFPKGVRLALDDEFPNGRRDFAVRVGADRCVRLRSVRKVRK